MAIETCDPIETLNKALCLTQERAQFYLRVAVRAVDPKAAAMFRSLAEDEQHHARIIQSRIDAWVKGEEWVVPECVLACNPVLTEPLFPGGKAAFEKTVRPDASDLDALLYALRSETHAYNLYVEQAHEASASTAKMYEYLADAERAHFDQLMLSYESIQGRGGWTE